MLCIGDRVNMASLDRFLSIDSYLRALQFRSLFVIASCVLWITDFPNHAVSVIRGYALIVLIIALHFMFSSHRVST